MAAEEGRVGSGKNSKQAVWNHSLILHAAGAAGEKKEEDPKISGGHDGTGMAQC